MRQNRSRQFNASAPPWLHCISRCVRRAFLCGDGFEHRRGWIEQRLQLMASVFAVDMAAYAVMSNHLHVVLRPRPERVAQWSDDAVVRAWLRLRRAPTPHGRVKHSSSTDDDIVALRLAEEGFVALWRERLSSASWFMKALKEPIARAANSEDGCTGAFWEGRFKSVPLLDEAALLTCMAYVDLNPLRAGLDALPEKAAFCSLKERAQQRIAREKALRARDKNKRPQSQAILDKAGLQLVGGAKKLDALVLKRDDQARNDWLCPISSLLGDYWRDFGPDNYFTLVDTAGRIMRAGKQSRISPQCAAILERIGCDPATWMESMATPGSLAGAALGHYAARSAEVARRCCQWMQVRCKVFAHKPAE